MEITRAQAIRLLTALGMEDARSRPTVQLQSRIKRLPLIVEKLPDDMEVPRVQADLLAAILSDLADGKEVEVLSPRQPKESKEDKPTNGKGKESEEKPTKPAKTKPAKPAKGKKATKGKTETEIAVGVFVEVNDPDDPDSPWQGTITEINPDDSGKPRYVEVKEEKTGDVWEVDIKNVTPVKKPAKKRGRKPKSKPANEKSTKTAKPANAKKDPNPKPGITDAIVEMLAKASKKKPITKEQIYENLCRLFPDRDKKGMRVTVFAHVPKRLSERKKVKVLCTDDKKGFWIAK